MKELQYNPLVQKFIDAFAYTGYLDWFKDEVEENEAILINDPSNICGIVYTDKVVERCKEDSGWNNYNYNGFKPSKKATNYILFEGQFYSCDFILKTFNKFFKDKFNFDIRIASKPEADYYVFLIKIDSTLSIGVAKLKNVAIKEESDGVSFIDTEWILDGKEEKEIEVDRHYVEWDDGKAVYNELWCGRDWKKVVYKQDYLFNKQEEIGDSLLI